MNRSVTADDNVIRAVKARAGEAAGRRSWHQTTLIESARDILRGRSASAEYLLKLADELKKKENRFGTARRLLALACDQESPGSPLGRKIRQRYALCTYKDPDLPVVSRLDDALRILESFEDLCATKDQESLGLAGAIHKRKWDVDARTEHLERSLSFYLRGYALGPAKDQGYTSINAAFVLDLLAHVREQELECPGERSELSGRRRDQARAIREELIGFLPGLVQIEAWLDSEWWYYATVGEAYFGLRRYAEACDWLQRGQERVNVPDWEFQSTATQLATLARIQSDATPGEFKRSEAAQALAESFGEDLSMAVTAYMGRVGLALSGGGFRASLYHIGVLAKLAELDMLRHVEVLSCVSGGSIVGAHYYLELRRLLTTKADSNITVQDYVQCVENVRRAFLKGVQKNIRTRVVAELVTNLRMIFANGYSRTMRVGELFERFLYAEVQDGDAQDAPWWAPWLRYRRWLTDLYILPQGEPASFRPRDDNWRRRNKVPELILNATTLNTGHNWQFTASWMGEPPAAIDTEVDGNYRLRRMYYWEAPRRYRKVRLGYAVAASACVPGLFEPLRLDGLYPDRTVRLVDGGVHDNQGVNSLIERDCNVILVSDASGQMGTIDDPGAGVLGVTLRSNSVLMSRVRTEQYEDLAARLRSRLLSGLMFIHLKKDLRTEPVNWVDCEDPGGASSRRQNRVRPRSLTRYGVLEDIEKHLAELRTDLDSFSDAEAAALMTSGYRMTEQAFRDEESLRRLSSLAGQEVDWDFLRIEPALKESESARRLKTILEAGAQRAFKVWRLSPVLKALAALLAVAAVAALAWLLFTIPDQPLYNITVGRVVSLILIVLAGAAFGKWILPILRWRGTLLKVAGGILLSVLGPLVVRVHLWVFDRLFLWYGRLERVVGR